MPPPWTDLILYSIKGLSVMNGWESNFVQDSVEADLCRSGGKKIRRHSGGHGPLRA